MKDANEKTLTINVRKLEGATALEVNANLFEGEINKVIELVAAHVDELEAEKQLAKRSRHQHDAILISGPRGSGKSTFMLTLKKRLEEPNLRIQGKIAQLEVLDPSLIDGDEIFLATIVARILGHLKDAKKEDDKTVTEAIKQLAPAMLALDGIATRKKLEDAASSPALFGERLLQTALSGLDVQARFSKFTHAAANALGVQFFVLYLDDVDTAFRQGAQVLETVRRYCADGTILPIVTGDQNLFQLVVREQVWKDLKQLRKAEQNQAQINNINSQVDELEGQYLLKLLRPERRLNLPGARDRLAEFTTVTLQVNGKKDETLEAHLQRANRLIFGMQDAKADKTSLPAPAGELLTQNMRQIRAVIAWLGEIPSTNADTSILHEHVLKILTLHPQLKDTALTAELLTAILNEGNYQPLAMWVCRHLSLSPNLYTLDPRRFGNELHLEPWRIAVLAVHAALAQRWRRHPEEQFAFIGAVVAPALQLLDDERGSRSRSNATTEGGQLTIPASWQLSGAPKPPWEVCARITASTVFNWQASRDAYYLRLRIHKKDGIAEKVNEQFAKPMFNPKGKLLLSETGSYPSGAGPWIVEGPACNLQDTIPLAAQWRRSVNDEMNVLLDWYTIPLRYQRNVFYVIDPLVGFMAILGLFTSDAAQTERALSESAARPTFVVATTKENQGDNSPGDEDFDDDNAESDSSDGESTASEAVDRISQLLRPTDDWRKWAKENLSGYTNSPSGLADILLRFRESQFSILANVTTRYWSVGWMLQNWALGLLNATLVSEASALGYYRIDDAPLASALLKSNKTKDNEIDIILKKNSSNVFLRNLVSVHKQTKKNNQSLQEPKLFYVLATCPLIGGLLGDDWAQIVSHFIQGHTPFSIPRVSSKFNTKSRQSKNTQYSAFSLLCGLMTPLTTNRSTFVPDHAKTIQSAALDWKNSPSRSTTADAPNPSAKSTATSDTSPTAGNVSEPKNNDANNPL
ncbi:ATP-binding protein [Myxococcota bacterium]|nr:ATP-binding protein [Myxococcota bacterium]